MSISYGGDYITDTDGGKLRPSSAVFRNRILNGGMVIDQRNAGASVTPTTVEYTLDRWQARVTVGSKFSVQQNSGDAPTTQGFSQCLKITSLSAYSVGAAEVFAIEQVIEGYNIADLAWGTASAKTVTLSFWVRSSLTGTFGGSLRNNAGARSYPFTYTISSANTWEQKSITIAGDTSGTWLTNNGVGIYVDLSVGSGTDKSGTAGSWSSNNYTSATGATSVVGTSGATFYITGVQLEVGSSATGFEYRQYTTELQLCQRYYQKSTNAGSTSYPSSGGYARGMYLFPTQMRATPTMAFTDLGAGGSQLGQSIGLDGFFVTYQSLAASSAGQFSWTSTAEL